jgi:hypothetical protein
VRHVRTLRLSAPNHQLVRRGSILVEDALRTASLPEADGGRLYVVRSLDIGTIGARNSSSSVALALERSFARAQVAAVHASDVRAAASSVVYFHDGVDAHTLLAVRLASGSEVGGEWFWHLAVPSFGVHQPREEALRSVLFSAVSLPAGPVAGVLLVSTLQRAGVINTLLAALRWQDGPALVRGSQPGSARGVPPLERPRSVDDLRLVERWARTWGSTDSRSVWLAAVVLAAHAPVRMLDGQQLARAERLLAEIARAAPRSQEHAGAAEVGGPPFVHSSSSREKDGTQTEEAVVHVDVDVADGVDGPYVQDEMDVPYSGGVPDVVRGVDSVEVADSVAAARFVEVPDSLDVVDVVRMHLDVEQANRRGSAPPSAMSVEEGRWVSIDPLPTECAGLYFVLTLLQRLHIASAPEVIQTDLGTRVLRHVASRLQIPDDDPVVQPLAEVDLLDRDAEAMASQWMSAARKLCRRSARMGLSALVRRHGLIEYTRTHIDVTFPLSRVDIRVRRAGLDIDPGWLPWFGRVVLFHYDG